MKHKHAEVIKAWADGAEIECRKDASDFWEIRVHPNFDIDAEWRVKPMQKEPIVELWYVHMSGFKYASKDNSKWSNLRLTFDGGTGKLLTAEVVK